MQQMPALCVREHCKTEDAACFIATAASKNGVFITKEICLLVILFHNNSMIKDESNKIFFLSHVFCIILVVL
jgi:hypothetical protein